MVGKQIWSLESIDAEETLVLLIVVLTDVPVVVLFVVSVSVVIVVIVTVVAATVVFACDISILELGEADLSGDLDLCIESDLLLTSLSVCNLVCEGEDSWFRFVGGVRACLLGLRGTGADGVCRGGSESADGTAGDDLALLQPFPVALSLDFRSPPFLSDGEFEDGDRE